MSRAVPSIAREPPVADALTARFWDLASQHVLAVQSCNRCKRYQHPPGFLCSSCRSSSLRYRPMSGRARLLSWTIVHRSFSEDWAADVPFTVFQVELHEQAGLTMISDDLYFLRRRQLTLPLQAGLAMRVAFEPIAGTSLFLPQFVPEGMDP